MMLWKSRSRSCQPVGDPGLRVGCLLALVAWWIHSPALLAFESPGKSALTGTSGRAAVNALLNWIAREHLPTRYEDRKDWGATREVITGWRLVGRGRKLRTAANRKQVNHGTWKMYQVSLQDPREGMQIELDQVEVTEEDGLIFQATVEARLEVLARWARWNWGVQLISLNALADVHVHMKLAGKTTIQINPRRLPPDVVLNPVITNADLQLKSFELKRISQLNGVWVDLIGHEARRVIEKKIAEKRKDLVAKINRQIMKNRDKLRVSLRDYLQEEWGRLRNR